MVNQSLSLNSTNLLTVKNVFKGDTTRPQTHNGLFTFSRLFPVVDCTDVVRPYAHHSLAHLLKKGMGCSANLLPVPFLIDHQS